MRSLSKSIGVVVGLSVAVSLHGCVKSPCKDEYEQDLDVVDQNCDLTEDVKDKWLAARDQGGGDASKNPKQVTSHEAPPTPPTQQPDPHNSSTQTQNTEPRGKTVDGKPRSQARTHSPRMQHGFREWMGQDSRGHMSGLLHGAPISFGSAKLRPHEGLQNVFWFSMYFQLGFEAVFIHVADGILEWHSDKILVLLLIFSSNV